MSYCLSFSILISSLPVKASSLPSDFSELVLEGDNQSLQQTLNSLDPYTPLIKEKDSLSTQLNQEQFLDKPLLEKTLTRRELARQKRTTLSRDRRDYSFYERKINGYIYGFCTWYVANKRSDIPNNWGNASNWLSSAQQDGFAVNQEPRVGAIIVTAESWSGHVAYVEQVNQESITISEMNKIGWNLISTRTLNINSPVIRGFIYSK